MQENVVLKAVTVFSAMFSPNVSNWASMPLLKGKFSNPKIFIILGIYNFGFLGWGVSEWHYRHHGGRPEAHSQADPVGIRHLPKY